MKLPESISVAVRWHWNVFHRIFPKSLSADPNMWDCRCCHQHCSCCHCHRAESLTTESTRNRRLFWQLLHDREHRSNQSNHTQHTCTCPFHSESSACTAFWFGLPILRWSVDLACGISLQALESNPHDPNYKEMNFHKSKNMNAIFNKMNLNFTRLAVNI